MNQQAREAKRILCRLWHLNAVIDSYEEQITRARSIATRATSSITATNVSGTGNRSKVETGALDIVELEETLKEELGEYRREAERAHNAVGRMEDMRERALLEMRYFQHPHKSWAVINSRLYMSLTTSKRVHESALISFLRAYK